LVQARFLLSAASAEQFPRTGIPEIALVGRSNVGKSSLINALTKQTIARTSAAPGKTRLANFYLVEGLISAFAPPRLSARYGETRSSLGEGGPNPKSPIPGGSLYLVDLPGYGYARGGPESVEAFEALTRAYFDPAIDSGRRLAGVLQLIDARHPHLPQDAAAFEWLIRTQLPLAIVATKMDKLKQSEQPKTVKALETKYGVRVIPESAMKGTGLDEIWRTLRQWSGSPNP
jgi:GTP-binding protein